MADVKIAEVYFNAFEGPAPEEQSSPAAKKAIADAAVPIMMDGTARDLCFLLQLTAAVV